MSNFDATWSMGTPSGVVSAQKQYSAASFTELEESVADGQTDSQITVAIDVSAVKAFFLVSTRNVTVETNSGSTPDNTIALIANVPYVFVTDSYNAFLLTTDVTALFITNASGAAATIKLRFLQDPTP